MRRRGVGRVHGNGGNALELHGEHRGAGGLDNRLAHRHWGVQRVENRDEQDLVTFSVLCPFVEWAIRPSFSDLRRQ